MRSKKNNLYLGILLVLTGLVLLLNNLEILPGSMPAYILSWKTFLLALGIIFLFTERDKTGAIVLIAVGFWFIIPDIWNINPREAGLLWPILFLAIGLSILLSGKRRG